MILQPCSLGSHGVARFKWESGVAEVLPKGPFMHRLSDEIHGLLSSSSTTSAVGLESPCCWCGGTCDVGTLE